MKKILVVMLLLVLFVNIVNSITLTFEETEVAQIDFEAEDPDGDNINYSFSEPFDEEGKWQTTYGDVGAYNITLTVTDGKLETEEYIGIIITKKEEPPQIYLSTPEEDPIIDEKESTGFAVQATDLNEDELTYEWYLDNEFVGEGSYYIYEPTYFDEGIHELKIIVSDGVSEVETEWEITVNDIDRSVVLDDFEGMVVNETDTIKLDLPDFGAYDLNYSISEPIGDDGIWETSYDDEDIYQITIKIWEADFEDEKTIDVVVENTDRPPRFTKELPSQVSLKEGDIVEIILEAADPDEEDVLFYTENLPEGAVIEENKFIWKTDYDTVQRDNLIKKAISKYHLLRKSFEITFIADSNGLTAKQDIVITIKDVNRAPILESLGDITVNEGDLIHIEPIASDPDSDRVVYSYSGWINNNDHTASYEDAGTHIVTVTASDGFLTDSKDIKIIIKDTNRAPIIDDHEEYGVKEGEELKFKVSASDPDGDDVTLFLMDAPEGASFKNNEFTWTPDFDVTDEEAYINVTFKAKDGELTAIKGVIVNIMDVNRAPEIINTTPSKDITVKLGGEVRFDVIASDQDGDELTYEWPVGPLNKYSGAPAMVRQFTIAGRKEIKVIVSDGKDQVEYVWNVFVAETPKTVKPKPAVPKTVKAEPAVPKPVAEKPIEERTPEELIELYGKYTVTESGGKVVSVTKEVVEVSK